MSSVYSNDWESASEITTQLRVETAERFNDAHEQFCDCEFIVGSDYGEPEVNY